MRGGLATVVAALTLLCGAATADAYIYWANRDNASIGRAKSNGGSVDQSYIATGASIYGVAVDEDHLYWTDRKKGRIGRVDRNGKHLDKKFITGLGTPRGLAVDSDYIYWADSKTSSVGRAALDGSDVNPTFIDPPKGVGDVAVDDQHVYWTNSFGLGRSDLDGTAIEESLVKALTYGVAVDAAHLFWAWFDYSPTRGGVGRANINGSGVKQKFIAKKKLFAEDVAVDDAHLWFIQQVGGIGRASLSGKKVKVHFIPGTHVGHGDNGLEEIAVDADGTPPETTIKKGPPNRTHNSTARFEFAASEDPSKFVCKLDKRKWRHCGESYELKNLKPGEHKLLVRATDEFGNTDGSPAKAEWTVR